MTDHIHLEIHQSSVPWHKAAEADVAVSDAYRKLVSMKRGMDILEEIPDYLTPFHKALSKALDEVDNARRETTHVREVICRLARR